MKKRNFASLLFILGGLLPAHSAGSNESALWTAFVADSRSGEPSVLPDYSYSGYNYMESAIPSDFSSVYRVEDFGAVADDLQSDRDAVQAAIDTASESGGVVEFGKGRYLLNTKDGSEAPLRISRGNVVLKGAGSGEDGTELAFERNLDPLDPDKMYSTPFVLHIEPLNTRETVLSKPLGRAERGSFELRVADPDRFAAGDWITLRLQDPKAVESFFGARQARPQWERLHTEGIGVSERHQVVEVEGDRLKLRAPLQVAVDSQFAWSICDYPALEGVGIEGLRFVGGWKGEFVHHRSALDDGGWSGIRMRIVRNGWIRDIEMIDWNYGIRLDDCSAFSVLRVRLGGTAGHHALHARGGYGVLFGLIEDQAGHFHGPGVGYMSASTVYWRMRYAPESSFDAHSTGPYATLLDACSGGWRYGRSGGPLKGMPNHMQGLTIWNFNRTGGSESVFDFWRRGFNDRDLFLEANVVGFHGIETGFREETLGAIDSIGEPVEPESLFEAQLSLRMNGLPQHLIEEIELWRRDASGN